MSNMAATLYCLNRREEAERQWLQAIKIRPQYLDPVEHLVGLLYKKRAREAVEVISYVQEALMGSMPWASGRPSGKLVGGTGQSSSQDASILDEASPPIHQGANATAFGSSGYAIPASENGRILALVHAKGTMLYSLKDVEKASRAFEEAVLISTGRQIRSIQGLVRRIRSVLAQPYDSSYYSDSKSHDPLRPMLLPPEKARNTAQLVFSEKGDLPGLLHVPSGSHRRAAVQTTSNALLSLAKIFQDSMANGHVASSAYQQPSGIGDILALYYLSLSLQESPSTANNVGILLASVQPAVPVALVTGTTAPGAPAIPGISPGSGLALALAYYNYGLRLDPTHVHLHTNLGSLLKDIGQLDMAIKMYEQAVSCDGTFDIALTNLANAVKDRGRIGDAIAYYKRAVGSNPDFAEAVCGLATALNSVCDWRGRGGVILRGGEFDRWHVDEEGMLRDVQAHRQPSGLMKRVSDIVTRQLEDSAGWGRGILRGETTQLLAMSVAKSMPRARLGDLDLDLEIQKWAGQPWEGSRVLRLIERTTRETMRRWYRDKYLQAHECPTGYHRPVIPPSLTVPSAPTVLPFHTFTSPLTAREIRQISQRNALRISCSTLRSPWLPASVYPPPPPPIPHLNVGYVSSDFNNHPLAHL